MNILVDHGAYALDNIGDWAMLIVTLRRLREFIPDAQITVIGQPERIAEEIPSVECCDNVGMQFLMGEGSVLPGRVSRWLRRRDRPFALNALKMISSYARLRSNAYGVPGNKVDRFLEAFESADAIVWAGGGYINDAFPTMLDRIVLMSGAAQRGKTTAMFSQGIGPLNDTTLAQLTGKGLRQLTFLGLREALYGPQIVQRLGVAGDRVVVTGDDAIEVSHECTGDGNNGFVGVNVRVKRYSGMARYLSDVKDALATILDSVKAQPVVIPIYLGSGVRDEESDTFQTRELLGESTDRTLAPITPQVVVERVGTCRLLITGSYHAAVFALAQGIPTIALASSHYYECKFQGLAQQFNCGLQVITVSDVDAKARLIKIAESLWHTGADNCEGLKLMAKQQISISRSSYRGFAQQAMRARS